MSQTLDVGEDKFIVEKRDKANFLCPIRDCDIENLIATLALHHNISAKSIEKRLEDQERRIQKEHEESLRKKREWQKNHEAKEADPLHKLKILYPRRHLSSVRNQMDTLLSGLSANDLHDLLSRTKGLPLSPHFTFEDLQQLENLVSFHLQTKR